MIAGPLTPMVLAASTYGRLTERDGDPTHQPRVPGPPRTTIAIITLRMLGPRKATKPIARISEGNARNTR